MYTAAFLQRCEEEFCGGEKLARYFDMIAGTSTGGIIALGLGLGIPTGEITGFYRDDGRRIFPPLPGRWTGKARRLWRWLRGPKLMHEELEKALQGQQTGAQALENANRRGNVVLRNFERANKG